jgi:hypothetical protein
MILVDPKTGDPVLALPGAGSSTAPPAVSPGNAAQAQPNSFDSKKEKHAQQ